MEFRQVYALRGPNVWARFAVLEAWVDLGPLKDSPSNILPGFNERLMAWLPTMIEHRCSEGVRGGFFERLRLGTYQAHIMEHVSLELQTLAGSDVGYGRARETSEEGFYRVALRYEDEELGRACLETARRLLDAAVYDKPFDVTAEIAKLQELGNNNLMGPTSRGMTVAAAKRQIPHIRLNNSTLIQLGYGARQKRIKAAETHHTGSIAEAIAKDKELTRRMLRGAGVPVPAGRLATSPEDAWTAALEVGLPAVVKPADANHGRGVALNLTTREQVVAAYPEALKESEYGEVIVERFAVGKEHRLLVVGQRMIAAAGGEPEQVTGDGQHTVAELVDLANADPRRGELWVNPLSVLKLDPQALFVLEQQDLTPQSVPAAGQVVLIHYNGDLTTDETDLVHPEVAAAAVLAARVVGLDVAGIDLIAEDLSRPLEEQGGVIVEVNAGPGLAQHLHPLVGEPRPVCEAILETLFPPADNGRIPLVGVTGSHQTDAIASFIARALRSQGAEVGLTTSAGCWVGQRTIDTGDCRDWSHGRDLLLNPTVEAAVIVSSDRSIFREGLPYDRCDVAVVTDVAEDVTLGHIDWDNPEKAAVIQRCVPETIVAGGWAVLNAEQPLVAAMAEKCKGSVVYIANEETHPTLVEHRAAGGAVAFYRNGQAVVAEGSFEQSLPGIHQGKGTALEECATLASCAALWKLGFPLLAIAASQRPHEASPLYQVSRAS